MEKPTAQLLFFDKPLEDMAHALLQNSNLRKGEFEIKRFSNNELYITLQQTVQDKSCFILGSIAPPDTNLFAFLLLCHTLQKEQANQVTAILPYLAYTRHDKNESQKSYTTALIGKLFNTVNINQIITFDIHSERAKKLFPMPVVSLSTATLFGNEIKSLGLQKATIVAPDDGAIARCEAVAKAAGIEKEIAYLEKVRTEKGVTHNKIQGNVGASVIIIDDMLDTGGTLLSCCKKLTNMGVKEIVVMVTHGIFTGQAWEELWHYGVKRIYCTDTIPYTQKLSSKIITLSIIPTLKHFLSQSINR